MTAICLLNVVIKIVQRKIILVVQENNISYFRICTRCSSYFCYQCCGLSHKILKLLNHRNDNCWFCPDCVKLALNAIFMDKDIEKKRQSYFSLLEPRIVDMEKQH